jgi:hypothetical protein
VAKEVSAMAMVAVAGSPVRSSSWLQARARIAVTHALPLSLTLMGSSVSQIHLGTRDLQKAVMRLNPPNAWITMMPGTMGTWMPAARQSATNCTNTSVSKNICVRMTSLPASTLDLRYAISEA